MVVSAPATAIACGQGLLGPCCNVSTHAIDVGSDGGQVLGMQLVLAVVFCAVTVGLWIVLRVCSLAKGSASRSGRYIVLNQTSAEGEGADSFNSRHEDVGRVGQVNDEPNVAPPRIHMLGAHLAFFTVLAVMSLLDLGMVFAPYSEGARVAQMLLFQLKNSFCIFLLSVLFWKWGGSRPLVLSAAFALVVFGVSYALPLAVSRATAVSTGSPRIDVLQCRNCPFFFFDTMTLFPSVINLCIWILGTVLAVRRKVRPTAHLLVVFMMLFHAANIGPGAAIAAGLLPEGVCVACVLQLIYAIAQPIVLAVTLVKDSKFVLGDPESFSGDDMQETKPLLGDEERSGKEAVAGGSPAASPQRNPAASVAAAAASSATATGQKKKQLAFSAVAEKPKVLSENQRIARFLLDNLEESVKVVEFDQVVRERKIGAGGFGEVFKGSLNGEEVAIKRVLDMDERKARTFLREINTMSRLQHPNITVLVGVAVSNEDCYLLTEYVQRGSLFDLLHSKKRKVRMSWANVIAVLRGTTVGMDYLHSMDPPFLHRDLKSQNLLIGDHWLVKICDFGMARVKSLGVTMTKLGTLQWVAPEVLRDERYSEKADIYSFAILVWEMVARAVPYVGQNSLMVARAVAYKSLRPTIPDHCPELFRTLMAACWADDANSRLSFKGILTFLDDIPPDAPNDWPPLPESSSK